MPKYLKVINLLAVKIRTTHDVCKFYGCYCMCYDAAENNIRKKQIFLN